MPIRRRVIPLICAVIACTAVIGSAAAEASLSAPSLFGHPYRLVDTRPGFHSANPQIQGVRTSGSTTAVPVHSYVFKAHVTKVMVNVTTPNPSTEGYVTVYPCDQKRPTTSNANLNPGSTNANTVLVEVGDDQKVCFYVFGQTDLVIDLVGLDSYSTNSPTPTSPSDPVPVTATRVVDTRPGFPIDDAGADPKGERAAKSLTRVKIAGRGGVPKGASGAVLNLTTPHPAAEGFVTVWDCNGERPTASNANLNPGQTNANSVFTRLSADGEVCVFTWERTHMIIDIEGYFTAGSTQAPVRPIRILDTREGEAIDIAGPDPKGELVTGAPLVIDLNDRLGMNLDGGRGMVLNVTAPNPSTEGYVTVARCGDTDTRDDPPSISTTNLNPGQTNANITFVSAFWGEFCVQVVGRTDVVIDLQAVRP